MSLASVIPVSAEQTLATSIRALDQARASAEKRLELARSGALHAEAGKTDCVARKPSEAVARSRAANAVWELVQVRERINHALADAAQSRSFKTPTGASSSQARASTCVPEVTHRADAQAIFSKPSLTVAVRMEHHKAGREGRHD